MKNIECDGDQILFIDSEQSYTYYPENTPSHFKVHLSDILYLEGGVWDVALLDFYTEEKISKNKKNRHELYIFSDICMGVNIFHNQFSLLRRIFPSSNNNWNYVFSNPVFVPVKKTEIRDIEIHILDENRKEATFLTQRLTCTLHIRNRQRLNYKHEC